MASLYALMTSILNLFTFSDAGPPPNSTTAARSPSPGTSRQRSPSSASASGSLRSRSYSTSSRANPSYGYDQSSMNEFSADYVNVLLPNMTVTMSSSMRVKSKRRGEESIRLKRWSGEHERERSASGVDPRPDDASQTPNPHSPLDTRTQNVLLDKADGEGYHSRHWVPEPPITSR